MRTPNFLATLLAATFLTFPLAAQMPPGSRAGDAPGMGSIGGQSEGQRLGTPAPGAAPSGAAGTPGAARPVTPDNLGSPNAGTATPTTPGMTAPTTPGTAGSAPSGTAAPSGSAGTAPATPGAAAPNTSGTAAPSAPGMASPTAPSASQTVPGSPRPSTTGEPIAPPRPVAAPSGPGITEDQARTQLNGAGYSEVQQLERTPNGGWRARAMRDGQQVNISVGTDGEVTAIQ